MKFKKVLAGIFVTTMIACFGIGTLMSVAEANEEGKNKPASITEQFVTIETFLNNVYKVGDKVELPTLIEDGKEYERLVCDPNGNAYISKNVTLSKAGVWSMTFERENIKKSYQFVVYPSLSTVNGTSSQVEVGKAGDYMKYDAQGRSGICTKIAYNESVTFNQIIDFNGKTKEDTVLEFSVFPETYGIEDASILVLTFSDIENPDNYFMLYLRGEPFMDESWNQRVVWVRSGAMGQQGLGLRTGQENVVYEYNGESYSTYDGSYDSKWGTHVIFSLRGVGAGTSEKNMGSQVFGVSMDYEEKQLFCYAYNNGDITSGPFLLNDFDSADLQGGNIWEGFSSGKCRLTVSAQNYVSPAFSMLITKLGDNTEFSTDYIVNDTPAEIQIVNADMSNVSYCVKDREFVIPKAVAYDTFGNEVGVVTKVYTGYKTGTQTCLDITNGYFIPNQLRDYTIEYTCVDEWGNRSVKTYTLRAVLKNEHTPFQIDIDGSAEQIKIGETAQLQLPVIPDKYIGRYLVKVEARCGTETIQIGEYRYGEAVEPFYFTPQKVGDWTIVYEYSDLVSEGRAFYTITAEGNGSASLIGEAAVPKYMILGAAYDIPDLYGMDYSGNEGVEKKAKLYITATKDISNAAEQIDSKIVWNEATDMVYYTYVLNDAVKQYEIPVVDVAYGRETQSSLKYFYGYESTPVVGEMGTTYKVKAQDGGAYKLGFINMVQAYSFKLETRIPVEADYSKLSIYLTDAKDVSNVLKLSYVIASDNSIGYSVNNGNMKSLAHIDKGDTLTLQYDMLSHTVIFGTQGEKVVKNVAGEEWRGFTSNCIWVEFELENVSGENTTIDINSINNQRFYQSESFSDLDMRPEFYQDISDVSAVYAVNEKLVIPKAYAADVFSIGISVSLTVTAPDGTFAKTVDGTELNKVNGELSYELLLTEYGDYIVSYTVNDDLGRINKNGGFQVSVKDVVSPTVTIDTHTSTASLNDKLQVAAITIVDNYSNSESCSYSVYVQCPNYDMVELSAYTDKDFILTMTGKYTVWYYVLDEAGNVVLVSYDLYVH